jgi:hypothetical protein
VNTAGRAVAAVRATAVTVVVAAVLAGCSVTVQPKNAAASHPLSSTPSPSAASTPSTDVSSPSATPSTSASVGKDVDHTVCTTVREDLLNTQQKVLDDKNSPRHMSQDYKNAAYNLRTQATKTKNSDLKDTLQQVASAYTTLATDVANHDSIDSDLKKVAEVSQPLGTLCGAKS